MENFYKKYVKYKEEYFVTIDETLLKITNNNNDIIKEEIYNLILNYIGVFDIFNLIISARKCAIDYNKFNNFDNDELQNQLILLEENITLINKKIITVQKKIPIDENNIQEISNRFINLFIFNRNNLKKFKNLLDKTDNNIILLAKINKININTFEYNNDIYNGYTIEMINKIINNKINNNKINRLFILLTCNLTQTQKDLELNNLNTNYKHLIDKYNLIILTVENINRNLKISYDRIKEIIIENIIIVNNYLLFDDTINEKFLNNENFFNEERSKICNKTYFLKHIEKYNNKRLLILKKYLLEKFIPY
jgi:hypothetical protein